MHLDQETLSRLVDGELTEDRKRRAEAHLAECAACSVRKAELVENDEMVSALLPHGDVPTPDVDPDELIRRARPASPRRMLRWAAALVLTGAGAGAAYAAPGSPLPAWLGWGGDGQVERETPDVQAQPTASGLMLPLDQPLTVAFEGVTGPGAIIVTTRPAPGTSIESVRAGVSFGSDAGVITVSQREPSSGDFVLNVPPDAASVRVLLDGRQVWGFSGGTIETAMTESPDGSYREQLR